MKKTILLIFLLTTFLFSDSHNKKEKQDLSYMNDTKVSASNYLEDEEYFRAAQKYEEALNLMYSFEDDNKEVEVGLISDISTLYFMAERYDKAYLWTKKLSNTYFDMFDVSYRLALFKFSGMGTKIDYKKAYENLKKVTHSSNIKDEHIIKKSFVFMGFMMHEGLGTRKNKKKGLNLYHSNLENMHVQKIYNLDSMNFMAEKELRRIFNVE